MLSNSRVVIRSKSASELKLIFMFRELVRIYILSQVNSTKNKSVVQIYCLGQVAI